MLGGLRQFAGGLGHQRLVRGDHGLAAFQRGQDGLARRLDRAHQLDDDVDVVAGHQFADVVGQHLDRQATVGRDPADSDATQFQGRTDAGSKVGCALLDDAHDLAADVAKPQYRYADWLLGFTHRPLTSKLSRSSTVSRRRISRVSPSRTATTAGRPSRLYRLDIE